MRRLIAAVLTLTLVAACNPFAGPPAQKPPEAGAEQTAATEAVRALYAVYQNTRPEDVADWGAFRSTALAARYATLADLQTRNDDPILDFDPIVGGQDWTISDLSFTEKAGASATNRIVTATFKNNGEDRTIQFDMIEENGAWKVDNISAGAPWPYDVRAIFEAAGKAP